MDSQDLAGREGSGAAADEDPELSEDGAGEDAEDSGDGSLDKDKHWMRAHGFSASQVEELKEYFSMFDATGVGLIAAHNMGSALRAMGQTPTEAELQEMLADASLDDEGRLDLDEFMRIVGERGLKSDGEMEEELEEALRVFDKAGEGCVDAEELKRILKTLGEPVDEEDLHEIMKVAEVAGDGKINYYDFMKKLTTK